MIDQTTVKMLNLYREEADAPMFLSGFFLSPASNFYNTEMVTRDIVRDNEDIAVPVDDLHVTPRMNKAGRSTNKGYKPPIFREAGAITAMKLLKRRPGRTPFEDPQFLADAIEESMVITNRLSNKVKRATELMSAQVLQTGRIELREPTGAVKYSEDFAPKPTHFPTVALPWSDPLSRPLTDLDNLARAIRRDGKRQPTRLIFGRSAMDSFMRNEEVKDRLDNRRMNVGDVTPQARGEGATFVGWVWVGHYRLEMWTYDGYYRDPVSEDLLDYVDENSVIMLSEKGRLDLTFGVVPSLIPPTAVATRFLPPRVSSDVMSFDLHLNAWVAQDGKSLTIEAASRPLPIPTAIDTFGCLTVG